MEAKSKMPRRSTVDRSHKISGRDVELLRAAIREGWPWRFFESDTYQNIPLDARLQICLSHVTQVYTLACGFPADPHPSDETVAYLRSELATDLKQAEKKWGKLVPKEFRCNSKDLRARNWSWGPREVY
jgi:hypothetical protein